MSNPLGCKVALLAKEPETTQFRIRKVEPFGLALHARLAALIEIEDQLLELIYLVRRDRNTRIIGNKIHTMNNKKRWLAVKAALVMG